MYILRYNHDNVFNFCVLLISQSSSWSLCQRKFSHSYSTVLSQKYPTLHCQQFWLFFRDHFRWLAEVWVRCEHPYRPLSLSVSQSLSLSCASLKCSHLVYMRLWSTECVSPQAQWVGMLFTFHPYLMQTASVNSCLFSTYPIALISKADSQEDAPFSIAPFMSCCDSEVSSSDSSSRLFRYLRSSLVVFCFLCVWWTAGPRGCNQDRVLESRFWLLVYQWSEWSVRILSWRFPEDLSDLSHHAWEEELVFIFLHHLPLVLRERESIDLWWRFPVVQIIHSHLALLFGNIFNILFPEWFCPNYRSKEAFTLVCDFCSTVFWRVFVRIALDNCVLLRGWSLQV